MTSKATTVWADVCSHLKARINPDVYARWIDIIEAVDLEGDTLILAVSNDFYQLWLEQNYMSYISDACRCVAGRELKIRFTVHAPKAAGANRHQEPAAAAPKNENAEPHRARGQGGQRKTENTLDSRYVFESFVIGPSNRFAHASSMAVAQAPGRAYNPLFIYGGAGLGKTHLVQAIGHYALTQTSLKVCYLSCESLMNDYVDSLQKQSLIQFRKKYRSTDFLLIDDVHFLSNKGALQEEFFHTFNDLHLSRKQMVMTSDRPPNEISGLAERLVSRFEWGQVTYILPPDYETRMAILKSKQKAMNISLSQDVLELLASSIKSNIRSLEGALTRVTGYAAHMNAPLTLDLVESLLRDLLDKNAQPAMTVESIQRSVAAFFDVRMADMTSKVRTQNVALPRQVAMYLCRTMTSSSLPEIGAAFGKTHATVLYAYRSVHDRIGRDSQFKQTMARLSQKMVSP